MTKKVKRVFIVRHAESEANIDWKKNLEQPDHKIEITKNGAGQADKAGIFLENYISLSLKKRGVISGAKYLLTGKRDIEKVRLWHSPYKRTRQTADIIFDRCSGVIGDKKEHLLLAEQRFGVFDGLSDNQRKEKYPDFHENYEKSKNEGGKMWPKMPLGDSRFDVCQHVHQAFGTFHRDAEKHGIENIVVVGHGTTNRAFILMWMHYNWEWMHEEPNPKNCSIRMIENGEDKGYIFDGF